MRRRLRNETTDRMADIEQTCFEFDRSLRASLRPPDPQPLDLSAATDRPAAASAALDFQRKVMSLDQQAAVRLGCEAAAAAGMAGLWASLVASGAVEVMQLAEQRRGDAEGGAAQPYTP